MRKSLDLVILAAFVTVGIIAGCRLFIDYKSYREVLRLRAIAEDRVELVKVGPVYRKCFKVIGAKYDE